MPRLTRPPCWHCLSYGIYFLQVSRKINIKKELHIHAIPFKRATDGARTRDPDLGKVVLYQLSHCRISLFCSLGTKNNIL